MEVRYVSSGIVVMVEKLEVFKHGEKQKIDPLDSKCADGAALSEPLNLLMPLFSSWQVRIPLSALCTRASGNHCLL